MRTPHPTYEQLADLPAYAEQPVPVAFEDFAIVLILQEEPDGLRTLNDCTRIWKDGRIEQQNFDTYPVMRLDAMPKVESILMGSGGFWGGVGEPTIAVAAPAVLNAVFAATGKRIRQLPVRPEDLKRT